MIRNARDNIGFIMEQREQGLPFTAIARKLQMRGISVGAGTVALAYREQKEKEI